MLCSFQSYYPKSKLNYHKNSCSGTIVIMNDFSKGELTFVEFPQNINIDSGNYMKQNSEKYISQMEMEINHEILKGLKPIVMIGRLVGVFNEDILSHVSKTTNKP